MDQLLFKTIQINELMAEAIINALFIADHESMGYGAEITQMVVQALHSVYPEVVNKHNCSELE